MATYGGAVDLILTELGRSDTSITAVVEREVLKAIEHYAPTRFWFNEYRTSFTASNTIYYPFSTVTPDLLEVDQVSVLVGSSVYELEQDTHQNLHRIDQTSHTGDPVKFAVFAEQFRLYPKCPSGSTRQIDVMGTKRIATLSASTESNEWTDEALNLIAARVEKLISARKFKDYEAAQMYQVAEEQELQRMISRTERVLSIGRLKANW